MADGSIELQLTIDKAAAERELAAFKAKLDELLSADGSGGSSAQAVGDAWKTAVSEITASNEAVKAGITDVQTHSLSAFAAMAGIAMEHMSQIGAMAGEIALAQHNAYAGLFNTSAQSGSGFGAFCGELRAALESVVPLTGELGASSAKAASGLDSLGVAVQAAAGSASTAVGSISKLAEATSAAQTAVKAGFEGISAVGAAGLKDIEGKWLSGAKSATKSVAEQLTSPEFTGAGKKAFDAMGAEAAKSAALKEAGTKVVGDAKNAVNSAISSGSFESSGRNISLGVARGIDSGSGAVASAARRMTQAALNAIVTTSDQHSPSRVTFENGENLAVGLTLGIAARFAEANNAGERLAQAALDGVSEQLASAEVPLEQFAEAYDSMATAVSRALSAMYREEEQLQLEAIRQTRDCAEQSTDSRIDAYRRDYDEYEDQHNRKLQLLKEEMLAVQAVYDPQISALQAQIAALDEKTKAEDEALRRSEHQKRVVELQMQMSQTTDPERLSELSERLNQEIQKENRRLLLAERSAEKDRLRQEIAALQEEKKSKLEEKQLEIDALNSQRDSYYDAELNAVKAQYKLLSSEASIQAQAQLLLQKGTQDDILALLRTYNSSYFTTFKSLGEAAYEGLKPEVDRIYQMIESVKSAAADMGGETSFQGAVKLPAFAREGVAKRPTLAIVGDTPDPEYMLREGTLTNLVNQCVSRVISNLSGLSGAVYSTSNQQNDDTVIYQTVNINQPVSSPYKVKRDLLEAGRALGGEIR